jgi:hypothetical protein
MSEPTGGIPPSAGVQHAVVKHVSQPYWEVNKFSDDDEEVEFFNVTYEVDEKTPDGENMNIRRKYRKSLHTKSNFRKDLQGILGRDITAEERKDFAPDSIEGMDCQVIIEHSPRNDGDGVWANITKVITAKAA